MSGRHLRPARTLRRLLALVTATLALVVVSGTAWAFWTVGGSGTATAPAGTSQPLVVMVTPTGTLFPGVTALPAAVSLRNPNPFPVRVTALTPGAVSVAGGSACTAAASAVSFAPITTTYDVAAGATVTATAPAVVSMGVTSANGCQGASFSAVYTATAQNR